MMRVVSRDVIEHLSHTRVIFSDARASPTPTNAMEVMERGCLPGRRYVT
jgi:hypothetical protein